MAFVRAKSPFRYRGARVQPGDVIEVPDKDVRLLVAVGRAEEAEKPRGRGRPPKPKDEPAAPKATHAKPEPVPEPVPEPAPEPEPERKAEPEDTGALDDDGQVERPKRKYTRRDLTAED